MKLVSYGSKIRGFLMASNDLITKRTFGSPRLEYHTSYLKGFEVVEEQFMLLTLSYTGDNNFELKMPLDHLNIKENRFIPELNIHDDDNKYFTYIIDSIYDYNGVILDDVVGEDGILHNLDLQEMCDYINSMSMLGIMLYFDDEELVYLDLFKISFPADSKYKDKRFEDPNTFMLNFSIVVSDVNEFYEKHGHC